MKNYLLDTNIILDDYKNIFTLSQNKTNTLYITETILNEIDKFKSGNETINFNAREFQRMLNDSEAKVVDEGLIVEHQDFTLYIMRDIDGDFENDDKIIETGSKIENITFISNDIIFRTKCLIRGLPVESLKKTQYNPNLEFFIDIDYDECFPNKEYFSKDELEKLLGFEIQNHISFISIKEASGKPFLLMKENQNSFKLIDLKQNINLFGVKPKNLEQRMMIELILSDIDIIVVNALAGSGKSLLALVGSLKLLEEGKYDKITYIRKTIISGSKEDELGFLPGDLNEKINPYVYPMKDNIEFIIKTKNKKKKKWSKEEIDSAVRNFENTHNINYEYLGHLRGRTLEGIIILDEFQNNSIQDAITILSRIGQNAKVIITGSNKQIDNPNLNKYNNALTFMLNQSGDYEDIKVRSLTMTKIERGPITKWIENTTNQ